MDNTLGRQLIVDHTRAPLGRRENEKVIAGFKEIKDLALSERTFALLPNDDLLIAFRCECDNPECDGRVRITYLQYLRQYFDNNSMVTSHGH